MTNHPASERFSIGTAVYAERADGKILLLKRAPGSTFENEFFLPGGAVDVGEQPIDGAARELAEEAGLVPTSALTLIGLYERPADEPPARLMVSYACTVGDGEPVLSHEHTELLWIEPEQMRDALAGATGLRASIREDVERFIWWRAHR